MKRIEERLRQTANNSRLQVFCSNLINVKCADYVLRLFIRIKQPNWLRFKLIYLVGIVVVVVRYYDNFMKQS